MIRKKTLNSKTIKSKLDRLEAGYLPSAKPFLAIIGNLPAGKYEVSEHIGVGRRGGALEFKSVDYKTKIIEDKDQYIMDNPQTVIIHDDMSDVEGVCKKILDDSPDIKIEHLPEENDE